MCAWGERDEEDHNTDPRRRFYWKVKVSESAVAAHLERQQRTAVADNEEARSSTAVAGGKGDVWTDPSGVGGSVAGDTVVTGDDLEDFAEKQRRLAPRAMIQGVRKPSSRWNSEPEVGNFGLFFGNWGLRPTLGDQAKQKRRRDNQDR